MKQTKYDIFISYRREGGAQYARTIQQALEKYYHVFLDYDELKDGVFNQRIIDAISESPVFLLILSKGALDRCVDETDWVRQEILHAMKCGCHIVPVTIVDDKFEGFPSNIPEVLQRAVGCHQFSELQMKTLFKASMEQLIKERIAPYVHREDASSGTEIHIETDADCELFRFNTFIRHLTVGDNIIHLSPGRYRLNFVSTQFPEITIQKSFEVVLGLAFDYIVVDMEEQINKKKISQSGLTDPKDQFKMGCDYYYGDNGKNKTYEIAIKWFHMAAEQGYASAQYNLGVCYEYGHGVPQDYKMAVKWYLEAAKQEDKTAQYNLGICYFNGHGVTQDYGEAVKWFRLAAEQGFAAAQYNLGVCYENGSGIPQSFVDALIWYRKAATKGYAAAQTNIGVYYERGCVVPQDYAEAARWYRRAAEQGYALAQFNLGSRYYSGQGLSRNYTEAVKWFRLAAEQGVAAAQYNLAICYYKGQGVSGKASEALKWLRKSAELGYENSKKMLKELG